MNILVSYQPEESAGEPIVVDLVFSESYDDVLKAACDMLKHELPPEDRIRERKLARFVKLPSGACTWVALHPDRFAQLVEAGPVDTLELRLQITCFAVPAQSQSVETELLSPSSLTPDTPPPYTSGPVGGLNTQQSTPATEELPSNNLSTPLAPTYVRRDSIRDRLANSGLIYDWEDISNSQTPSRPVLPPTPTFPSSVSRSPTEWKDNADALFNNGVAAFLAGRYPDASYRFQRAAKEYRERPDLQKEADCLRYLGTTCRFLKAWVEARLHLTTARQIYEGMGPSRRQEQLQCDRHLARIHEDSGNTQAALVAYQELIHTCQEEGLTTQEAWCTYHLGHLYSRTRRYEEAFGLLKDAIMMARRVHNVEVDALGMEDMGYIAEQEGHPQLAMDCYDQAFGQFKTGGDGKWVTHENRVKNSMDQLRRGFPSLFSTIARSRKRTIGQFANRTSGFEFGF